MSNDLVKVSEDSTRGGFFLTLGNTTSILVSAASVFIIARILGPEQYGLYSISTVIPSLLLLFVDPGINQGLMKYAASLRVKGEEKRISQLLLHGLSFKIVLGLIATFTCFVLSDQFARILNRPEISPYIQLASTLIILQTVYTTINSTLVGLDKTEHNALVTNVQAVIKALISSFLVILGLGIFGALSGYVMGSLVATLVGTFILYRIYRSLNHKYGGSHEDFSSNLRLLVRYGFPLYVSALLAGFVLEYQNILLAVFTSNDDIGNFRAAINFTVLISTISMSMGTTLLPAFSKLEQKNDEAGKLFKLSIKYGSMIVLPIATAIMLYSNEIVEIIYGGDYTTASLFLSLAIIQFYLVGLGSLILGSLFNGLGDTKTTLKISLISGSTFLVLAPLMTWILKVPGMIMATLISSLFATVYGLSAAKSKLKVKIEAGKMLRIYLAAFLPVIPMLVLQRILPLTGLSQVILGASLYFTGYLILTPLTRVISQAEIQEVKTILEKTKPLKIMAKPLLFFEEMILSKI